MLGIILIPLQSLELDGFEFNSVTFPGSNYTQPDITLEDAWSIINLTLAGCGTKLFRMSLKVHQNILQLIS